MKILGDNYLDKQRRAVVENMQKQYKTFILIEDVKVNVGLDNREFTKGALERKRF